MMLIQSADREEQFILDVQLQELLQWSVAKCYVESFNSTLF